MFSNPDDYLGVLLTDGPPASRCEWLRTLPSDDFGPRALARCRLDDRTITVRGVAIADAAWQRCSPRLQALASVEEEHVGALLAYGRHEGLAYFIHEHHDGPRLTTVLREQGGSLPRSVVLPLFAQVLLAVGDAHRGGVVVGGVRPQEIRVVAADGHALEIKLRNFGLATVLGVPAGRRSSIDHPSLYRAPDDDITEQPASDVFSLAVLFVRLLTGPLDRSEDEYERSEMLRTRLQRARHEGVLDDALVHLLTECIEIDPLARPRTAIHLLEALLDILPAAELRIADDAQPEPFESYLDSGVEHWPARQWTVLDAWERPRGEQPPRSVVQASAVLTDSGRAIEVPPMDERAMPGGTLRVSPVPRRSPWGRALRRVALGVGLLSTGTAVAVAATVEPEPEVAVEAEGVAADAVEVEGTAPSVERIPESRLLVETSPPGRLTIDGLDRGPSNESVVLEPGLHVVRVEAPGHRSWRSRIDIEAGTDHRVQVVLQRESRSAPLVVPTALADVSR